MLFPDSRIHLRIYNQSFYFVFLTCWQFSKSVWKRWLSSFLYSESCLTQAGFQKSYSPNFPSKTTCQQLSPIQVLHADMNTCRKTQKGNWKQRTSTKNPSLCGNAVTPLFTHSLIFSVCILIKQNLSGEHGTSFCLMSDENKSGDDSDDLSSLRGTNIPKYKDNRGRMKLFYPLIILYRWKRMCQAENRQMSIPYS